MGNIKFINAGAGSGKTYRLTEMFCEQIEKDAKPSQFILTTYTKAAADEFRSKIKSRLIEKGMTDVFPLVESAHIGTIHSVAQSYIEKYWYLLDMSPALAVREEDEMKVFRSGILDSVTLEEDQEFFYDYSIRLDITKSEGMRSKPDPDFWRALVLDIVDKMRLYGFDKEKLSDFKASSLEVIKEIMSSRRTDLDSLQSIIYDTFNDLPKKSVAAALTAWDTYFIPFFNNKTLENAKALMGHVKAKKDVVWSKSLPQEFFDAMSDFILSSVSDLVTECVERLFAISERLYDKIEEAKRIESIIEFSDIEVLFLRLLSNDTVRTDLKDSIKHVFVDEFQDVSPIQLKIFQALSEIIDDNCWVGDPKQAIYGFRGSDSSLVKNVITSLEGKEDKLKISRRSLPQLVNVSNDIFVRAFSLLVESESLKQDYVKLDPWEKKMAEEDLYEGKYHGVRTWTADVKKASDLYSAMASKLWTIFNEKKFPVTDTVHDKLELRDLKYGDVAILTRSGFECTEIAKALRAKGLPVSVLDNKLVNQVEVKLVLTLMKYIAGIDKKLSFAELRKLINDDDLETILIGLAEKTISSDLHQLLETIRVRCQHRSVYEMVRELIALLDLRHLVSKWSMGQKRQANLDALVSLAATFVQRKREASVLEFIFYVADKEVEVPFDNTGNTIKVLTYHKSKGLQWKMVILNCLYKDYLDEDSFIEKDFSKLTTRTAPDGQVSFNLFPPVELVNSYIAERVNGTQKAQDLWDYLMEKKRAEDLRLLYVGFTRAENYLVMLSLSGASQMWLENTRVTFGNNLLVDQICDDSTISIDGAQTVTVLPYENVLTKVERQKKYISPSQCEADPKAGVPTCELETIADNIDVARWSIDADVFGTCIHNYMAVHRWASDHKYDEKNVKNAGRVIEGFGLGGHVAAENLVKQADAFFTFLEKKYGKVETIEHEIPFTRRKAGQVITGEIDLYVRTESGDGILVDFKNPMTRKDTDDQVLKDKAIKYWPQLDAYRDALTESGCPVNHVYIYYPMMGIAAELKK